MFDSKISKKGVFHIAAGLLVAATVPFLAGCAKHTSVNSDASAYRTPAHLRQHDIATLRAYGVQVIHLGQTYRLVIPSTHLFNPASANLTGAAHRTLNKVASLLNSYHVISVRVAAYTDSRASRIPKDALTQRQASVVQAYLSDRGLKARLIYGAGEGDNNPVAWNGTWAGRNANRRVEISFMYIPTKTIYM